jgi:biopolymer transport protein ExbD
VLIKAKDGPTAIAAIEMTPLVDMVFLLLIFFLVATTFRQEEREMQVALPVARAAGPITPMLRELIINVDRDGGIIVGGQHIEAEELRAMVAEAVANNPEQKVTVRGDRGTAYANVVRVLEICKNGGIQEPYLDTVLQE